MDNLTNEDFPLTIAAYFGSPEQGDPAQELHFDSVGEYEGYLQGQREADGWFEANFVPNGAYYVNKDGDYLERKGAKTDTADNQRHIIWGEHPEPGTRAETFDLDTPAAATAFEKGVNDMVGWSNCYLVPSTDFACFEGFQAALDSGNLSDEAARALRTYVEAEYEGGLEGADEDLIFVNPTTGAFVKADWDPREPVISPTGTQGAPAKRRSPSP